MIIPKRKAARVWKSSEKRMLCQAYGSTPNDELARVFDCSVEEIEQRAKIFALRKNKGCPNFKGQPMPRWSVREVEYLVDNYAESSNLEIALALGRSTKSVVSKASHMGLKKSKARRRASGKENVAKRYSR